MLSRSFTSRTLLKLLCFVTFLVCRRACFSQSQGLPNVSTANLGASTSTITISGVVLNAVSGIAIPRVLVQWNGQAILTDHEGKFLFDQVDSISRANSLQVNKPGFYAGPDGDTVANISLPADQPNTTVTIRLFPEGLLSGTLSATDGTPLSRVLVIAQRSTYNDGSHQWNPSGQNQTNSRGEFRIVVPPGDYRLETGYVPHFAGTPNSIISSIYPAITSSETSSAIHLSAGAEERITLHPDVVPTYPVALKIEQVGERNFPRIMARSSTGATIPVSFMRFEPGGGGSKIELPLGTYTLAASMNMGEASEYGETSVTVTGQNTPEAVLRMASVAAIPVEVVIDQGSAATSDKVPIPQQFGLMLTAMQQSSFFGNPSVGVMQNRDRSYFHPSPGTYRLVSRSNGQWFIKSAVYGATDLLQQDLVVAQGSGSSPIVLTVSNQTGSLQGTAKLAGIPASAWIYLIPSSPAANSIYSVRSSPAGVFNFAYLPSGSYRAIGFELRHEDNYRDPDALSKYTTFTRTVTITAGNKTSLDLDAVSAAEMLP
jgi:hypothetical protein